MASPEAPPPGEPLAHLRAVLGPGPCEEELRRLLHGAGNDVGLALNRYYDSLSAPAGKRESGLQGQLGGPSKQRKLFPGASAQASEPRGPAHAQGPPHEASAPPGPGPAAASAEALGSEAAKGPKAPPREAGSPAEPRGRSGRPLAERVRPQRLEELLGQEEALGAVIRQAVEEDRLPSLVLWGPPGCGKTSFAHCVAAATKRAFRSISAAKAGLAELREELSRAAGAAKLRGVGTILFVDELHRWSKAQQDALLLDCEKGTVTLIGATTENPSFSLNNAILSRCRLVVFGKLRPEAIRGVVDRALSSDPALAGCSLTEDAQRALAAVADGDARVALNTLELAAGSAGAAVGGGPLLDADAVRVAAQRRALYDRNGDFHYDLISALHKSMRGGCADGALYYATRMLTAGEEPRYLTRRLIRFASEDVGLADPQALCQAVAADQAVHAIGMPEAGVVVAQCVVYLALAPKSCAVYRAYEAARKACEEQPHAPVPLHIRNAPTAMMRGLGYSKGYEYNPALGYARGCALGYLPAELGKCSFFAPADCEPGHRLHFCAESGDPKVGAHAEDRHSGAGSGS